MERINSRKCTALRTIILLLVIVQIFSLTGCGCKHEWSEATCTEPQICSKCGATEGEALGHDWIEATCTEPRKCSRCGLTDGDSLGGHIWKDATNVTPKKCTRCGETDGGCALDGSWGLPIASSVYWKFVFNTSEDKLTIYEVGDGYCDHLFDEELIEVSNDTVQAENWLISMIDDDTVHLGAADDPDYSKTMVRLSYETSGSTYDNTKKSTESVGKTKSDARHTDEEAFACACHIVKDELLSPSTAKFCKITDAEIEHIGDGNYYVKGWVEAENRYGALVKCTFQVTYVAVKEGSDIGYKEAKCSIY